MDSWICTMTVADFPFFRRRLGSQRSAHTEKLVMSNEGGKRIGLFGAEDAPCLYVPES